MKRIKNFLKRNLKYSIAFIIGILVHLVVYASTTPLYTSNQIGYDNTNSNPQHYIQILCNNGKIIFNEINGLTSWFT